MKITGQLVKFNSIDSEYDVFSGDCWFVDFETGKIPVKCCDFPAQVGELTKINRNSYGMFIEVDIKDEFAEPFKHAMCFNPNLQFCMEGAILRRKCYNVDDKTVSVIDRWKVEHICFGRASHADIEKVRIVNSNEALVSSLFTEKPRPQEEMSATPKGVAPQDVVNLLNEALELDPLAVTRLVNSRVPCNDKLANHPTIQVVMDNKTALVGLMGIINGIFGLDAKGYGRVGFQTRKDVHLIHRFGCPTHSPEGVVSETEPPKEPRLVFMSGNWPIMPQYLALKDLPFQLIYGYRRGKIDCLTDNNALLVYYYDVYEQGQQSEHDRLDELAKDSADYGDRVLFYVPELTDEKQNQRQTDRLSFIVAGLKRNGSMVLGSFEHLYNHLAAITGSAPFTSGIATAEPKPKPKQVFQYVFLSGPATTNDCWAPLRSQVGLYCREVGVYQHMLENGKVFEDSRIIHLINRDTFNTEEGLDNSMEAAFHLSYQHKDKMALVIVEDDYNRAQEYILDSLRMVAGSSKTKISKTLEEAVQWVRSCKCN